MHEILEFIKNFDVIQLIALAIVYFALRHAMNHEVKEFKEEMKIMNKRLDKQSERSDKLYEMFIDLLKEKKS